MSSVLSVLVRTELTSAMLTSSTVAEPYTGETAWNAATNYALGAVVYRSTTHHLYENLIAGVDAGLPENSSTRWFDRGADNRWSMLDGDNSTATTAASPMTYVLTPGHFNAIYFDGLDDDTLAITIKDAPGGTVTYTHTFTLEGSAPPDYYEYFFDRFKPQKSVLISGLEPYNLAEVSFTLTSASGSATCAVVAFGDLRPLGNTLMGAKAKPKSYSRVTTDSDGNNVIKRGKKARDMSATAIVDVSEANDVLDTITDLMDVALLWMCSSDNSDFNGLRAYGLGSGDLTYDTATTRQLNLSVIGVI